MKKLILYTLIFISPFIITVIGLETLLRKIPNAYMVKADFLKTSSSNTQILILGSSHGITGINPRAFSKSAFNTANYAQTLDIDYKILEKYQDKLDSLEYVIVPLSYHLLWTNIKDHPQRWRRKYYNIYYDIDIEQNPLKRLLFLDETMKTNLQHIQDFYSKKENPIPDLTPRGFIALQPAKNASIIKEVSEKVISAHTSSNLNWRYAENVNYLKKIIEIGRKKNAKTIFVTIPAHISFVNLLNQNQLNILHSTANELADNKDVFYYDCLNDFNNSTSDKNFKLFFDSDHLSYLGAEVFSHKLDSIIKVLDKRN